MAADVIGSALIQIDPDFRNFQARLQSKLAEIGNQRPPDVPIGFQTEGARRALEQAIPKRKQIEIQATGLGQIQDAINSISNKLAQIAGGVGGIGGALGVGAAVYGVKSLVSGVQELFDPLEKARIGFKAILGEKEGEKFLQDIRQFAKVTPFETQPLVQYSQRLLGIGTAAKDIIPLLTNVGNLVTAKGGDNNTIQQVLNALTQIRAVGRLTGQDALQLQSALINPYKLIADQSGRTLQEVRKLSEQGKITADEVFNAVSKAGSKFAGAMEANTRTISGAISVLSDTVKIFLQDNLRPIFDFLVVQITNVAATFQANIPKIQAFFRQAFETARPTVTAVLEALKQVATVIGGTVVGAFKVLGPVIESVTKFLSEHAGIVKSLAVAYFAIKIIDFINGLKLSAIALAQDTALKIRNIGVTNELAAANARVANNIGGTGVTATQRFFVPTSLPAGPSSQVPVTAAAAAAAGAAESTSRLVGVLKSVGPAAAIAFGTVAQSSRNAALSVAGTTAQFAGLGFYVGGPWGAAIGAGVGLVGGLLSKLSEDAKKHLQAIQDEARKTASSLALVFEAELKADSTRPGASVLDQIGLISTKTKQLTKDVNEAKSALAKRKELESLLQEVPDNRNTGNPEQDASDNRRFASQREGLARQLAGIPSKDELTAAATVAQGQLDQIKSGVLKQVIQNSNDIAAALNATSDAAKSKLKALGLFPGTLTRGGVIGNTTTGVDAETGAFRGLNVEVLKNLELKAKAAGLSLTSAADIEKLLELTTATTTATNALKDMADAYDKVKEAAAARNREIQAQITPIQDLNTAQRAFSDTLRNLTDAKGDIGSVYNEVTSGIANVITSYQQAGITGAQFDNAIQANITSLLQSAQASGITNTEMRALLSSIQQILANANINITVDADTSAALAKIAELKAQIASLGAVFGTSASDAVKAAAGAQAIHADDQIAAVQATIANTQNAILDGLIKPGAVTAAKPGGGGANGAQKVQDSLANIADKIKAAGDDFRNKVIEAGKQLVQDLFKQPTFENSKSAASLTRNALRQAGFLDQNAGFVNDLKARGLSQAALDALGVTGGVGDFKRLRKLDAASTSELVALDAAISARKQSSEKTAEVAKAQIWAEEFRKVLGDLFVQEYGVTGGQGSGSDAAKNFTFNLTAADAADPNALAKKLVDAVLLEFRRRGKR